MREGTATRRRGRRCLSVTFPAGFVELTTRNEPRHSFWATELAAHYPDLGREARSRVLSALTSRDLRTRLGGLGEHTRVAAGLALDGPDLRGLVLLTVTAVGTDPGWSPDHLREGLAALARSRPGMRIRTLPCAEAEAILVERPVPFGTHTDLFLADRAVDTLVLVSAFVEAAAPVALLPTLTEIAGGYRSP